MIQACLLIWTLCFGPSDCNTNGIDDAIDTAETVLPAPPSQFLAYVNAASSSDIRATTRLDDFILTSPTRISSVEVEGRGGGSDRFLLRIWDAYSLTPTTPGTSHPLAVRYQETLTAGRITFTPGPLAGAPNSSTGRWRFRLAGDLLLPATAGGTTYFLEVVYTGTAATPWTWERISPSVGSSLHAGSMDRGQEFIFVSSTPSAGLRFRLYTRAAADANADAAPDGCADCNGDGTPDSAEPNAPDCNTNGRPDACDLSMLLVADCNSNGVPDECEAADCNTNGTNDACDIAAALVADCNTNAVPDSCELGGLSALAVGQMEGMSAGPAVFQGFSANRSTFARADDFVLAQPTTIGGLAVAGFFDAVPTGATHRFTVRICGGGGSIPGSATCSASIEGANLTHAPYQPLMFGASQTIRVFRLRLDPPVTLPAGPHWLETFYDGTGTSARWSWGILEPQFNHLTARSADTSNESWTTIDNKVRFLFDLYRGANDCNTNGQIDACEPPAGDTNADGIPDLCQCPHCPGDLSGDGRIDGDDLPAWVRCTLELPLPGDHCGCMLSDRQNFAALLLNSGATDCP